jgi:general secretion pathway protein I
MKRIAGFTLIEVLVALGIVAIALVAGLQATAALTNNAQRQTDVFLAHICAENQLTALRLSHQMPSVGTSVADCDQAGERFSVHVTVAPTPNPNFRRIDAQVFASNGPVLRLSTVMGRF